MFLAACLLLTTSAPVAGDPVRITSKNYELEWHGTRPEADEMLRILDSAFEELATFFAARPSDPLRFRVFRDERSRLEGAWNDGATVPAQSKYSSFSEVTRTAYVARIAGRQATRSAVLYGACLQFHSLAKAKNIDIGRTWHASGIALDFSRSTWDGSRIVAFASPRVEPVDLPGKALLALGSAEKELPGLSGIPAVDPALTWGVAAMCMHGGKRAYRDAFQRYALGDSGTKLGTEDFLRTLGPQKQVIVDLRAYLNAAQTPFEAIGDWEDRGAAGIRAYRDANTMSFCTLREGVGYLSARISALPKSGGRAGFVAGWFGEDDYARIDVEAPEVLIHVLRLGKIQSSMRLAIPGGAGRERRVELERVGNQYVLLVDGGKIAELELPSGRMGFFASGADVTFRDVSWR